MSPLEAIALALIGGLLFCTLIFLLVVKLWTHDEQPVAEMIWIDRRGNADWLSDDPPTWEW